MMKYSLMAFGMIGAFAVVPALANDKPKAEPATIAYPVTMDRAEAGKVIGHRVENRNGERVGEIEGIHIGKDGKVADVIVGVGGFLGMGERNVALKWSSLHIVNDPKQVDMIDKVVVDASKDQLKNMPAYTFAKPEMRRSVFDTPL